MILRNLIPSSAVDVRRFDDIDTFRMPGILGRTASIPLLKAKDFTTAIAHTRLPDCIVTLQRSFPRIADAEWQTPGLILLVPMEATLVAQANGVTLDSRSMLLVSGQASFRLTELNSNLFSAIRFATSHEERGWPVRRNGLQILRVGQHALSRLQLVIAAIFTSASSVPEVVSSPLSASAIQEDLLHAVDAAFADQSTAPIHSPRSSLHYARLVGRLDELMEIQPSAAQYTDALAHECGASPRTLHTAVTAVRGMSLHQYIRLRRLWRVRRQLVKTPQALVKDVAIANGFWHQGEFASTYRRVFGETPSSLRRSLNVAETAGE